MQYRHQYTEQLTNQSAGKRDLGQCQRSQPIHGFLVKILSNLTEMSDLCLNQAVFSLLTVIIPTSNVERLRTTLKAKINVKNMLSMRNIIMSR